MMVSRCILALALALLGSGACQSKLSGELAIDTGRHRDFAYVPEYCADGGYFGFFGVQLRDDGERVLELFRDDDGRPGLAFYAPHGAEFELGEGDCTTLDASLMRQYNHTTESARMEGWLEVDCAVPGGWTIAGELAFERCDYPEGESDDDDEHEIEDDLWIRDGL